MTAPVPIIVIRPQSEWHGDARIDTNVAGYWALRYLATQIALFRPDGNTTSIEPFASDGEGYTLTLTVHSDDAAWALEPYYTGLPAEINADRFRHALERIAALPVHELDQAYTIANEALGQESKS